MREYSKVYPQIWIGDTGRQIKKHGVETQLLAQYLISSPHSHMIGIYYLPFSFIAHELGISIESVTKAMHNLIQIDFCTYDDSKEYVWVYNMGFFQIAKTLKPNDNQVKSVNNYIKNLPELPFMEQFLEKYAEAFNLQIKPTLRSPSEPPLKGLRSQEKEQDKENEKEQGEKNAVSSVLSTSECLLIPLKENSEFQITQLLIDNWQKAYPCLDVKLTLKKIQEWNIANPDKRKTNTSIVRHIDLWLAREQERKNSETKTGKQPQRTNLFNLNQSIADEWLKMDSIFDSVEMH